MKKFSMLLVVVLFVVLMSGCTRETEDKTELDNGCIVVDSVYADEDSVECGVAEYTLIEYILLQNEETGTVYNRDVNLTVEFNERDYDFWLIRIVSRTRDEDRDIYIYEVEEVGDEDYFVMIESKELFSIDELCIGVESEDVLFLIDFNNGDVVIPKVVEE